jgi:hypothetical protein
VLNEDDELVDLLLELVDSLLNDDVSFSVELDVDRLDCEVGEDELSLEVVLELSEVELSLEVVLELSEDELSDIVERLLRLLKDLELILDNEVSEVGVDTELMDDKLLLL